jgi:hypothetical protein
MPERRESNSVATRARRARHDETVFWKDESRVVIDRNVPRSFRIDVDVSERENLNG